MKKESMRLVRATDLAAILILTLSSFAALASEEHAAHGAGLDEQTLKTIIYQAINVGALIVGLIYFLRKPIQDFFKSKREAFVASAQKAQASRVSAEAEREQIQIRLNKLESTADESISRAKADAIDMKNQLISDAMAASKRIQEEAAQSAKQEVQRAINHLREELIKESALLARNQLSSVATEDQIRLQGNFINNMEGVR